MQPEMVGVSRSRLVLGKHSGRHALKEHLGELGYKLSQEEVDLAFERYKQLADKKKVITDADLEALVEDQVYQSQEVFYLDGLPVGRRACTATVRLRALMEATSGRGWNWPSPCRLPGH
jgi:2-isopropylmalate synthase